MAITASIVDTTICAVPVIVLLKVLIVYQVLSDLELSSPTPNNPPYFYPTETYVLHPPQVFAQLKVVDQSKASQLASQTNTGSFV